MSNLLKEIMSDNLLVQLSEGGQRSYGFVINVDEELVEVHLTGTRSRRLFVARSAIASVTDRGKNRSFFFALVRKCRFKITLGSVAPPY